MKQFVLCISIAAAALIWPVRVGGNWALPVFVEQKRVFDASKDPKLGFGLRLRNVHPSRAGHRLVVYGESCSSCALRSFEPQDVENSAYTEVFFIYNTSEEEFPSALRHLPPNVHIIADESGAITKELNAAWFPRFYLCDATMRLERIQNNKEDKPTWLKLRNKA
jgi:hypothetical protein